MICPLHRIVEQNDICPECEKEGIKAMSVEYDKQDRVRDTMTYLGCRFEPTRSRAIMVFTKEET